MTQKNKVIYDAKKDETFQKPVIDCREIKERKTADGGNISYHYIHGFFEGTNVKFLFCFPQKEQFQWRFIQHLSPFPGPDEELAGLDKNGEDDFIAFALTHGMAYVESNMGSGAVFGSEPDSTIFYRSSAAVAEHCRVVAQELFGEHKVYGFAFGGSGGGYKTMSCLENTNAFDGGIPFVIGSPVSLPNCLTVWAHGARLLRHCWERIVDAAEPGGHDIYDGLNEEEAAALRELICIGVPPRTIVGLGVNDDGALPVLAPTVHMMDPTYFTDFWTKPGYLGTAPDSSAVRDRIRMRTKVVAAANSSTEKNGISEDKAAIDGRNGTDDAWQKMMSDGGSAYIEVEEVPRGDDLYLRGVDIVFESGKAKGRKLRLGSIEGNRLIPGMSFGADDFAQIISMIQPGDEILIDNSDYIAIQTYHRHQVPDDLSFHAFDQYRDTDGKPIYPQRDTVISYGFTAGGCGSVQDGQIQGKVIVMNNLMDGDFPWQADWYRRKVEEVNGEEFAMKNFRLWYNDNCPHGDASEVGDDLRVVSYLGMLRQALLDLADWTEKGIEPTPTSGYRLIDNQVILDEDPKTRCGVQPMVKLLAEGGECAKVKAGEQVRFCADVTMPEASGEFELAEFSFEGEQDYPYTGEETKTWSEAGIRRASVTATHVFDKPGTYFPTVRVVSNRQKGDAYTRLRNLCRARVVVE